MLKWVGETFVSDEGGQRVVRKIHSENISAFLPIQNQDLIFQGLELAAATTEKAFAERLTDGITEFEKSLQNPKLQRSVQLQLDAHLNRVTKLLTFIQHHRLSFGIAINRDDYISKKALKHIDSIAFSATFERVQDGYQYQLEAIADHKKIPLFNASFTPVIIEKGWFILNGALCCTPDINAKFIAPFIAKTHLTYTLPSGLSFVNAFVKKQLNNPNLKWFFKNIPSKEINQPSGKQVTITYDSIRSLWLITPTFNYHQKWITCEDRQQCFLKIDILPNEFSVTVYNRDLVGEQEMLQQVREVLPPTTRLQGSHFEIPEASATLEQLLNQIDTLKVPLFWIHSKSHPLAWPLDDTHIESHTSNGQLRLHGTIRAKQATISISEFYQAAKNNLRVVLKDNLAIPLPTPWRKAFADFPNLVRVEGDAVYINKNQEHLFPITTTSNEAKKVTYSQPSRAILRPYQVKGVSWLLANYSKKTGVLLADDMGLGKTLQVLTVLQTLKDNGDLKPAMAKLSAANKQLSLFDEQPPTATAEGGIALVLLPVSLLYTWQQEAKKFFPDLRVYRHHGQQRQQFEYATQYNEVILTSYNTFRTDADLFQALPIAILIADEAQALKNHTTKIHKATKKIQGSFTVALSGTPVENAATDLWSIYNVLNPTLLGSLSQFEKNFPSLQKGAIAKDRDIVRLKTLIGPYLLRRTKDQVATELPELTRQIVWVEMTTQQAELYENYRVAYRQQLLKTANDTQAKFNSLVLKTILHLRQIANHPNLLNEHGDSGKFDTILEDVRQLVKSDKKVLIFSSFKKHLTLIQNALSDQKIKSLTFTGADSPEDRERAVQQFMKDKEKAVLLMTLKAGGVGLTLTAADYVFLVDPWWNPQAEEQAISRAHRIGTTHPITAVKYLTIGSIEERIYQMQQNKTLLAIDLIENNQPLAKNRMEWIEAITGKSSLPI